MHDMRTYRNILAAIVVLICLVNGSALYWHLYFTIRWLDIPVHLLGGFWVGSFALYMYYRRKNARADRSSIFVASLAFSSALLIGLFWELYEYYVNSAANLYECDMVDTLSDLANDAIGAISAAVLFLALGYNKMNANVIGSTEK
jgi:uncharacterized membrane-anchored protein